MDKPRDLYLSSFKILSRFVVDELIKYDGPYPYIDGLVLRITRNYSRVLVAHDPRREGRSGYTLRKLVSLYLNMFTNFSILPLRLASCGGAGVVARWACSWRAISSSSGSTIRASRPAGPR